MSEDALKDKIRELELELEKKELDLLEKDKYIRDLKNDMGKLRKDYTQLQQEFEKFKNTHKESSVIRVEDPREKDSTNWTIKPKDVKKFKNKYYDKIQQFFDTDVLKKKTFEIE